LFDLETEERFNSDIDSAGVKSRREREKALAVP